MHHTYFSNLSGANENMLKSRNTGKYFFAEINDIYFRPNCKVALNFSLVMPIFQAHEFGF